MFRQQYEVFLVLNTCGRLQIHQNIQLARVTYLFPSFGWAHGSCTSLRFFCPVTLASHP